MPRNEDGEFELVLGNKQLLSVFFLVVVLLGVFFTMGYVVGRSSGPLRAAAEPAQASKNGPAPITEAAVAKPAVPAPADEPVQEPPAPIAGSAPGLIEPQPGERYLQVLATARTEADLVAETLRKKGYAAHVAVSSSPGLFRVLVGPFSDTAELAKTRDNLIGAGFQKPIVRPY